MQGNRVAIVAVLIIILLALISLILVLGLSLGLGWLLSLLLPFTLFEASLLVMVAGSMVGLIWYNLIWSPAGLPPGPYLADEADEENYNALPPAQFYKNNQERTWENWLRHQIANDIYLEFQDTPDRMGSMKDKELQTLAIRFADLAVSMVKTKSPRTRKLQLTKNALKRELSRQGQRPDEAILDMALAGINDNLDFYYEELIQVVQNKTWHELM